MTPELDISLVIKNEKSAPRRALHRPRHHEREVRHEGHYINEEINYDSDDDKHEQGSSSTRQRKRTGPEARGSDIGRRVRGGANGLKRKPNDPNTLTPKHMLRTCTRSNGRPSENDLHLSSWLCYEKEKSSPKKGTTSASSL